MPSYIVDLRRGLAAGKTCWWLSPSRPSRCWAAEPA